MKESSYEDLRQQRADEWASAQRRAEASLSDLHAQIAKMPDVQNAPAPGQTWSERGVKCYHCLGEQFVVERYTTVNGTKHRAQLACVQCQRSETWDWGERRWLVR
jgi:hypothetical protein